MAPEVGRTPELSEASQHLKILGKLALIRLSPKKIQLSEVEQLLIRLKENGF